MVLNAAYRLARRILPDYAGPFSRRDFTLPQLFACLVLREFYGLSYRRTQMLLGDSPQWLADIGLSAKVRTGNGSDAPDFDELLFRSWKRARVKVVVADAGYDSEANHCIARQDMGVRSIIPPGIGRPTVKLPTGRWRRHMAKRCARKADQKQYGQRAQSETVHSMMKRNQGSALRSRTPERRKQEMLLKVLTHNIALACEQEIEL